MSPGLSRSTDPLLQAHIPERVGMSLFSISIQAYLLFEEIFEKDYFSLPVSTFDFDKLNYVTSNNHHRRTVILNLKLMATAPAVCLGLDIHHEKLAAVPREVLTTIMSTAPSSSISVSPLICADRKSVV